MTIVESMKLRKRLAVKAEDLRKKLRQNCAHMENQSPMYPNQKEVVAGWLQAHRDIVKLMGKLSVSIQKTNIATNVTIVLGGKEVTKTIAEWVVRRRELATQDLAAYQALNEGSLRDVPVTDKEGKLQVVKVIRYFDPKERDGMVDLFANEPSRIDSKLEVVNATTSLVDAEELDAVKEDDLLK